MQVIQAIEQALKRRFEPVALSMRDESAAHAGHAAAGSGSHLSVTLVSGAFRGLSPVRRHRLVYQALQEFGPSQVHALRLQTLTPEEWNASQRSAD